jgi:DNA-binding transcriptional ArsR family regulator
VGLQEKLWTATAGSLAGRSGLLLSSRGCFGTGDRGKTLNHMVQSSTQLDVAFAALSDPTRRGILESLCGQDATISELAAAFGMTLTGIKKHVGVLEQAGLVTTEKVGRVRRCSIGPRRLDDETTWIATYRRMLESRLDRLGDFLERQKGSQS